MDAIGNKAQIPKIIHYCWFGGKQLPNYAIKCINSWKKYCPDYEIIEWNESNYDVNKIPFIKEAYENKKWAFVSDYARLDVVYNFGGIYLDTDVELIKNLDFALNDEGFSCYETSKTVAFGLGFGSVKFNPIIKQIMSYYENSCFILSDGKFNLIPSPSIQSDYLKKIGFRLNGCEELCNGFRIYEKIYFNPYDLNTGKIKLTEKTVSIHHYKASWVTTGNRINTYISQVLYRLQLGRLYTVIKNIHRKLKQK